MSGAKQVGSASSCEAFDATYSPPRSIATNAGAEADALLDQFLSSGGGARQRPDTAYLGSPYSVDRVISRQHQQHQQQQQQQQEQYLELLAQQSPSNSTRHRWKSTTAAPIPNSPPPRYATHHHQHSLPAQYYNNSLWSEPDPPVSSIPVPQQPTNPCPRTRGHVRATSAAPTVLPLSTPATSRTAAAAAQGASHRASPSGKGSTGHREVTAAARYASPGEKGSIGQRHTRAAAAEAAAGEEEGGKVGLLQRLGKHFSPGGGKLLGSGNRVSMGHGAQVDSEGSLAAEGLREGLAAGMMVDGVSHGLRMGGHSAGAGGVGARNKVSSILDSSHLAQAGVTRLGGGVAAEGDFIHGGLNGDGEFAGGSLGAEGLGGEEEDGSASGVVIRVGGQPVGGDADFAGAVLIERVECALLWREPWLSVRALGLGLYLILCVQQAVNASHYLRPITLLLATAFLILVANLAASAYRTIRNGVQGTNKTHSASHHHDASRHVEQQHRDLAQHDGSYRPAQPFQNQRQPHHGNSSKPPQASHSARQPWGEARHANGVGDGVQRDLRDGRDLGGPDGDVGQASGGGASGFPSSLGGVGAVRNSYATGQHGLVQERVVYEWTHLLLSTLSSWVVPLTAAGLAVAFRALNGRRLVTTVLVAGTLWLGMLLSELDVVGSATFYALLYTTLFTLPATYLRCRLVMDNTVETVLRFLTRLLVSGDRSSLLFTSATLLLVFACSPFSIVARTSLALVSSLCVLVYTTLIRPPSQLAGYRPAPATSIELVDE